MIFLHFLLKTNFLSISNSYIYIYCLWFSIWYGSLLQSWDEWVQWTRLDIDSQIGTSFLCCWCDLEVPKFYTPERVLVVGFFSQLIWYIVVPLPYSCLTFIIFLSKSCFLRLKYQPIKIQGLVFWAQILYLVF